MKECISIHVGQAGVQMGAACWQRYCLEHDILPSGLPIEGDGGAHPDGPRKETHICRNTFYSETEKGRLVPRTIMADLEPTVIDEVRNGDYKTLYHPDQLISAKEDAANNFARGHSGLGRDVMKPIMERLRKMAEECSGLQGFLIFHSLGGGTGSGVTARLLQKISDEFSRKSKLEVTIYPSPKLSTAVVEPYNAILSTHMSLPNSDCAFMLDNEAIYGICHNRLGTERPTYSNLNSIISLAISSITASLRFEGVLNADLSDYQTNLVPYPRIHFPTISQAPVVTVESSHHGQLGVPDITNQLFEPHSQMVTCNPESGKYMGCCLMYRGDVVAKDVNDAIAHVKSMSTVRFVDWCPTGFKISINNSISGCIGDINLASVPRSVSLLANTTAVTSVFSDLGRKFDLLFSRKAFVHWFVEEGMEEQDFRDARDDIAALEMDYKEIAQDTDPNKY